MGWEMGWDLVGGWRVEKGGGVVGGGRGEQLSDGLATSPNNI